MSVLSRWRGELAARRKLRDRAKRSVAYWARRAGTAHGKTMVREARNRLALLNKGVGEAQRVVDRHAGISTVSNAGVAFIASFEGFRSHVYDDGKGVPTIGFGETQDVHWGMKPWTRALALQRLRTRVNQDYLAPVLSLAKQIGLRLEQHQADALASLVYNLGPGILARGRTMGDALRSKNRKVIAEAFLVYDEPNNPVVHAGLARRRRAERARFLK